MNHQLSLFDTPQVINKEQLLLDLFTAYYHARKNKRNTINQLEFEIDYESNLLELYENIITYNYTPKRSICFIINKPIKREIFAADFSDRVVHHLIYNYIYPIFDKSFIPDSYSCRKGKGTHYGIKRIDKFIRECSHNYATDCYILKLDVKGYFMAINKQLLYDKAKATLLKNRKQVNFDFELILYLIKQTIFYEPTKNCIVKGKYSDWNNLPASKSLFRAGAGCGLPIGNLTSQLFGNIYMDEFDKYVTHHLGIKYYGRYVDDFVIVHSNKEYLKSLIPQFSDFLQSNLKLTLHPEKIYLQHYTKGVKYLGAVIKPNRIYIANRTKGNFYETIEKQNQVIQDHKPTKQEREAFLSSMNSYLGIMKHYKSYKLRKKMIFVNLSTHWWKYVYLSDSIGKLDKKVFQNPYVSYSNVTRNPPTGRKTVEFFC